MLRRSGLVLLLLAAAVATVAAGRKPRRGDTCVFGQAECLGGDSALFCGMDGAYLAVACRGRDGCERDGARVSCDQSIALDGDACTRPGFACSADLRSVLACREGQLTIAQRCEGPFGCRVAPFDGFAPGGVGNVLCDNDVARSGDPCLDDGDRACTADRTEALVCSANRMVTLRRCDGPGGCSVVHRTPKATDVECDSSDDAEPY